MPETPGHGLKRGTPQASRKAWWLAACLVGVGLVGLTYGNTLIDGQPRFRRLADRVALKELTIGVIKLKKMEERNWDLPLAARLSGRTQDGTLEFADPDADFQAAGLKPGDTLFILSGQCRGTREVAGVDPTALTLKGAPFAGAETGLAYFIRRADGRIWPEIDIVRELDPDNPAWAGTYAPRANTKRVAYYRTSPSKISKNQLVDLWGQPYIYTLQVDKGQIVEKIVCSGPDRKLGTPDDLEEVIAELPFGEADNRKDQR